jgi:hypothetical protein
MSKERQRVVRELLQEMTDLWFAHMVFLDRQGRNFVGQMGQMAQKMTRNALRPTVLRGYPWNRDVDDEEAREWASSHAGETGVDPNLLADELTDRIVDDLVPLYARRVHRAFTWFLRQQITHESRFWRFFIGEYCAPELSDLDLERFQLQEAKADEPGYGSVSIGGQLVEWSREDWPGDEYDPFELHAQKVGLYSAYKHEDVSRILDNPAPWDGQSWSDRLNYFTDGWAIDQKPFVRSIILGGLTEGAGRARTISRLRDALPASLKHKAAIVANTEMARIQNAITREQFDAAAEAGDVIGLQWLATFDTKTCIQCADLDKTEWYYPERFKAGPKAPQPLAQRIYGDPSQGPLNPAELRALQEAHAAHVGPRGFYRDDDYSWPEAWRDLPHDQKDSQGIPNAISQENSQANFRNLMNRLQDAGLSGEDRQAISESLQRWAGGGPSAVRGGGTPTLTQGREIMQQLGQATRLRLDEIHRGYNFGGDGPEDAKEDFLRPFRRALSQHNGRFEMGGMEGFSGQGEIAELSAGGSLGGHAYSQPQGVIFHLEGGDGNPIHGFDISAYSAYDEDEMILPKGTKIIIDSIDEGRVEADYNYDAAWGDEPPDDYDEGLMGPWDPQDPDKNPDLEEMYWGITEVYAHVATEEELDELWGLVEAERVARRRERDRFAGMTPGQAIIEASTGQLGPRTREQMKAANRIMLMKGKPPCYDLKTGRLIPKSKRVMPGGEASSQ